MGTDTILPGVTLDPRDEAGLEQAFGVTSNAEELVKNNRARYTAAHRTALNKDVDPHLTDSIHELDDDGNRIGLKSDLEDALGFPVESAVVRGSGRNATISYVYVGPRGSLEKGIVQHAEVFGSAKAKREARKVSAARDPEQAGREAADAKLAEADREAAEARQSALEEAQAAIDEARAQAEELLRKANEDAARIREEAAQEAAKAAAEAQSEAEGGDAKQTAARSGSSRSRAAKK